MYTITCKQTLSSDCGVCANERIYVVCVLYVPYFTLSERSWFTSRRRDGRGQADLFFNENTRKEKHPRITRAPLSGRMEITAICRGRESRAWRYGLPSSLSRVEWHICLPRSRRVSNPRRFDPRDVLARLRFLWNARLRVIIRKKTRTPRRVAVMTSRLRSNVRFSDVTRARFSVGIRVFRAPFSTTTLAFDFCASSEPGFPLCRDRKKKKKTRASSPCTAAVYAETSETTWALCVCRVCRLCGKSSARDRVFDNH